MSLTEKCIQRPYQTVILGQTPQARSPLGANGQPLGVNFQGQTFAVDHHELRVLEPGDYLFYCIFCGQSASQYDWVILLRGKISESQAS